MKAILVSGLLGGLVFFLLGGLFYGFLLADFFSDHMPEGMEIIAKDPVMPLILLGDLFLGLFFAYVFDTWTRIHNFSEGAWMGLALALGFSIHYTFIYSGTTHLVETASAIVDISLSGLSGALGGGVVGHLLGKMTKT
jgi:hypothetical protein